MRHNNHAPGNHLQSDQTVGDDAGLTVDGSDKTPKKAFDVQNQVQDSLKQTMTFGEYLNNLGLHGKERVDYVDFLRELRSPLGDGVGDYLLSLETENPELLKKIFLDDYIAKFLRSLDVSKQRWISEDDSANLECDWIDEQLSRYHSIRMLPGIDVYIKSLICYKLRTYEYFYRSECDQDTEQYNFASRWQSLIAFLPKLRSYHRDIILSFGKKPDGLYNILEYIEVFPEVLGIKQLSRYTASVLNRSIVDGTIVNINFEDVEELCRLLHIELSSFQVGQMILLNTYVPIPNLIRLMNNYPDLRTDEQIFRFIVSRCKKQIHKIYGTLTDEQNHIVDDIEKKKLEAKEKKEQKQLEKLDRIMSWCNERVYYGMSAITLGDCERKYGIYLDASVIIDILTRRDDNSYVANGIRHGWKNSFLSYYEGYFHRLVQEGRIKGVGELIDKKIQKQFQKKVQDEVFSESALSIFFEKYGPETNEYKSAVEYLQSIHITYILHPGALISENTGDEDKDSKNHSNTQSERVFSQQDSGIQNIRMVYPGGGDLVECVALLLPEQLQVVIEPIIPNRAAYIVELEDFLKAGSKLDLKTTPHERIIHNPKGLTRLRVLKALRDTDNV